ncbi:MAG TPA: chitobiase/beta-hexosaminidase C-terminal domain-containing protein [Methylomirabilota bacterium]|nr:chitobiase/beta-hexosaminidase C-terminal domain-containing protein [Methylomirabilota bacterium]
MSGSSVAIPALERTYFDDFRTHVRYQRLSDGGMLYARYNVGGGGLVPVGPSVTLRRFNRAGMLQWEREFEKHVGALFFDEGVNGSIIVVAHDTVSLINPVGQLQWVSGQIVAFDEHISLQARDPRRAIQGPDGAVWLAGLTKGQAHLQRLSASGVVSWSRDWDVQGTNFVMAPGLDGSMLFVIGHPEGSSVSLLSARGIQRWQKSFPLAVQDALQVSDGILLGYSSSAAAALKPPLADEGLGGDDIRILKLDRLGNPLRDAAFGGAAKDTFTRFKNTSADGILVLGTSASGPSPSKLSPKARFDEGSWVVKIDEQLQHEWDFTFPTVATERFPVYPRNGAAHLLIKADGTLVHTLQLQTLNAFVTNSAFGVELMEVRPPGKITQYAHVTVARESYPSQFASPEEQAILIPSELTNPSWHILAVVGSHFSEGFDHGPLVDWTDSLNEQDHWQATVTLESDPSAGTTFYTLDGSIPTTNSFVYTGPFNVRESKMVQGLTVLHAGSSKQLGAPVLVAERIMVKPALLNGRLLITTTQRGRFQLEQASSLVSQHWEPVGAASSAQTFEPPIEAPLMFYRLRRLSEPAVPTAP